MKKLLTISLILFVITSLLPQFPRLQLRADGTYYNINTTNSNNGGTDAVSWSQAKPFMVDNYGHYIVPISPDVSATVGYKFAYSNDKGTTWAEDDSVTMNFRTSAVYDSINDKIHIVYGQGSGIGYKRFTINRDGSNNITGFTQDSSVTPFFLDDTNSGSCSFLMNYPEILFKDSGSNGMIIVVWDAKKTCSSNNISEVRASLRTLSNSSADGTAANWKALNGVSDSGGSGPANVDYNVLYQDNTVSASFQHATLIRGGSGTRANDIYFFNNDNNQFAGFRRIAWNASSSNWSGSWTSRVVFGAKQDELNGYSLKEQLMTKPVYASGQNRVYIGLAVWLEGSNTKGDTQSLYYVDASDNSTDIPALAQNIYSAGGTHCIYPTMDISYDSTNNQIYYFYDTSGSATVCGNVYYKTYDGHTLSSAQPFYSVANRSVDIPITYSYILDGKIQLFFRLNNASTPGTPPHQIYYGYVPVSANATPTPIPASGGTYSADTTADFDKTCAVFTASGITDVTNGEVANLGAFRDDFDSSTLFNNYWGTGVWSSGTFSPTIGGTVLVYGSGGAYAISSTFYQYKTLEFRANFTNNNFQHIGFVDTTAFGNFILFSTKSNGQLNTRVFKAGSTESGTTLGTSYYGSYHTYKIVWGASSVTFYIDGTLVDTESTNIPSADMTPILSNNDTSAGSNLTIDWLRISDSPSTSGTYQSCTLDSGVTNAVWGAFSYATTLPSSTSLSLQTRTSADDSSWTSWSSNLTSGSTVTSSTNRYLQFLVSLTGISADTPSFNNMSVVYVTPTPTPSPTSTPTPTPTSSPANSLTAAGAPICNDQVPNTPQLYLATPVDKNSVKLFFTDPQGNYDSYFLEYGTSPDTYQFGADNIASKGTTSYIVKNLNSNTRYYFRVRTQSGCMPGAWSNEISAKPQIPGGINITTSEQNPTTTISVSPTLTQSAVTLSPTPTPVQAPIPGYDLTVHLVNTSGNPLVNAKVTLHSVPQSGITDNQGNVSFVNVDPGEHSLEIESANFSGQKQITLAGDVRKIEITVEVSEKASLKWYWLALGFIIGILITFILTKILKKLKKS